MTQNSFPLAFPTFLLLLGTSLTTACGGSAEDNGDGDGATPSGDGDITPGDGDGDITPGDGDGDVTPGEGDGDITSGDGDGDVIPTDTVFVSDGTGVATEEWAGYCTATFPDDYQVLDEYGDPAFIAKAGESYLIAYFGAFFVPLATLQYLTDSGSQKFEIWAEDGAFPFTSNCEIKQVVAYDAVFVDTTVYATETFETVLCELPAGLVRPGVGTWGYFGGPSTFQITLGGLSGDCGGAEKGYISVPPTETWGTSGYIVPISQLAGPSE